MKGISIRIGLAIALFCSFGASVHAADVAVIVNKSNSNEITRTMIEKIFTGDMALWPGGGAIAALDLPESSDVRASFTQQLLGKSVVSLKAVWSVKLFSGKATPPKTMNTDEEVRSAVANNKNAVGYIKASSVDGSVKAVLTLK